MGLLDYAVGATGRWGAKRRGRGDVAVIIQRRARSEVNRQVPIQICQGMDLVQWLTMKSGRNCHRTRDLLFQKPPEGHPTKLLYQCLPSDVCYNRNRT